MVNHLNILVTGSDGQLGRMIKSLSKGYSKYNFFFTNKKTLDITQITKIEDYLIDNKINFIVNCAAFTDVVKSENHKKRANLVNNLAVGYLSQLCNKYDIKFIHISTDYVFDGLNYLPYKENEKPNPVNYYGLSKLNGENRIFENNLKNSIIIRTSWLYSHFGNNFVSKIMKNIEAYKKVIINANQTGSPTNAKDLAEVLLKIIPKIKNKKTEIYHFSSFDFCSRFEFASEICRIFNYSNIENKICEGKQIERPIFSALDTKKISDKFGLKIINWKKSLQEHFDTTI
tara:strand:- start:226 stop:1086 length:861 start_codon:yes stop_codon:yes gene_type:complete